MATLVDITGDVAVDVDSRRAYPLIITGPPEDEGSTCGVYFAGEEGADGYVENVAFGPYDATGITLGHNDWSAGAVALTDGTTVNQAIRAINDYIADIPTTLESLSDVDISSGSLNEGDILTVEGGVWVPKTPVTPPQELAQLTDVDVATAPPSNDDVLTYEDGVWVPKTPVTPPQELSQLTDVDIATAAPSNNDVLTYEDGVWVPKTPGPSGPQDGFALPLGDITAAGDGSWSPGAVPLTNSTAVSEAVDLLNEVLAKLVPSAPPTFPNSTTLTVSNSSGSTPLLAGNSVTDNSGTSSLVAGNSVTRITAAGVSSNSFGDVGPGDSGTVAVLVNGATLGSRTLTGSGDTGNYGGLVISDQKDYPPATPGFWKSIDIQLTTAAASQGINKARITHSAASNTNEVYFVRDNVTSVPTISGASVTEATAGSYAYSSSVPHYGTGGQLNVNASYSNLSGETYYGGSDPFVITGTNSIIASKTRSYANIGISTPIDRQTTSATAISQQTIDVDGSNIHNSGTIQGTARNVNGASATVSLSSTVILVKRGSATGRLDENSITVSGLGSSPNSNAAVRVSTDAGDKPAAAPGAWNSASALATHEAALVAGLITHNQTNYSAGYLPAGPDLSSGRSGAQYVTFSFNRSALSAFKIAITGSYAGCWIKLPGVSDAQPNGGGWWNMFQSYDGSGIPGETGDANAGCALGTVMSGGSGTFQATFGTGSSTNSTGNQILVRLRLNSGQSVSALSFTN